MGRFVIDNKGVVMNRFSMLITMVIGVCLVFAGVAAGEDDKKWDVEAPLGPTTEVDFVTDEGTWMNLDVSPDGKDIVFDLLGDIYIMPIEGGDATLLRGGPAFGRGGIQGGQRSLSGTR